MSLFRRISKQLRFLNSSFPLLVAPLLSAADSAVEDTAELEQRIRFSEAKAMDTEFLPLQTAAILDNFYRRSFGGPENWAKVQSMRFDGILHLPQGKIRFIAFKKKPNLCKVVIFGGGAQRMIMAYDGEDAWQLMNSESDDPVDMPELEAINFIRDAELGGNLMFPKFPGKQIERLKGRIVEGSSCLVFKVTRPDGQEVEYAIDATTYSERQMTVTNAVSGEVEVTTHFDFRDVAGVKVPFRSVLTVEGEQRHEIQMLRVQTNTGAVPWMFARAAATYIPPNRPLQTANAPVVSVDLQFPGEPAPADFILPELNEKERQELLQGLD